MSLSPVQRTQAGVQFGCGAVPSAEDDSVGAGGP